MDSQNVTVSVSPLFTFPIPACSLPEMMLVTPSLEARSQELGLIRLWAHQGSQWAPENKTLCSAWRPVCLHCNYTDCSSAMVDASTHKGFTMERTNRDAHLCPTMNSKPSSQIVLFVMISWTRETSQTGHNKLNHHSSWQSVFLVVCMCRVLQLCEVKILADFLLMGSPSPLTTLSFEPRVF